MQNVVYTPTLNLSNESVFSYCFSYFVCIYYIVMLFQISSLISSTTTLCELSFNDESFIPCSSPKPFRKKHKPRKFRCKEKPRSLPSSSFADDGRPFPFYYKHLHVAHFGSAFDQHCASNPNFIDLFGACPPCLTSPSMPWPSTLPLAFPATPSYTHDLSTMVFNGNPFIFQSVYFSAAGTGPLIFDTGASVSISPHREDFVDYSTDTSNTTLQGVSASTCVAGRGTIQLTIHDNDGFPRVIRVQALHVPQASVRLLSIQSFRSLYKQGSSMTIDSTGASFKFPTSLGGNTLTFNLREAGNLPCVLATRFSSPDASPPSSPHSAFPVHVAKSPAYTILASSNQNLTTAQKLLLDLHWRLMHINFAWIHWLLREGIFKTNLKGVQSAQCKCHACQLGKQTRLPKGTMKHTLNSDKVGGLKRHSLSPGAVVSTDQFVSSVKGRLPHTFGKEHPNEQFQGGTVFVDEASDFVFVQNQVSLNATETLQAKGRFEREAMQQGILIKSYRGDNGIY